MRSNTFATAGLSKALLRRPDLWPELARFVPRRWWATWPPIPVPRLDYLRFRYQTMYGHSREASTGELIDYLKWCKRMTAGAD
ncbi:MAG: hypothetical protein ACP5P1_00270 [Acidimicrobiales bacterium]